MAKRMRRAYLKQWSNGYINTGSRDDAPRRYSPVVMQQGVNNHRHEPDTPKQEFIVKNPYIPPNVLAVAQELMDRIGGTVRVEHKITLRLTKYEETAMFYGMKGQVCFLVQKLHDTIIRRSPVFDSRAECIKKYKDGKIIWVETINIKPAPV